jgi:DNA-binding NarL/FixJ family response regulator
MVSAHAARETLTLLRSRSMALAPMDRLYALIDAYANLVPADAWAFAYRRRERTITERLSGDPGLVPERVGMVRAEIAGRQNSIAPPISTPVARTEPFRHGLTVHLNDERGGRAALVLLREEARGDFAIEERALLAQVRCHVLDFLSSHANFEGEMTDLECAKARRSPEIVLLDEHLAIEYVSRSRRLRRLGNWSFGGVRLPRVLENQVREVTAGWNDPAARVEDVFMPTQDLVVRVIPVERANRYAVALVLEPYARRAPLGEAIRRFRLSDRELEVIALLFTGLSAQQVAKQLKISLTTVNDHVKRLLNKTSSANRVEMAAKLLGWRSDAVVDTPER